MRSLDGKAGLQDHRGKDIYGGKARIRWKRWDSSAGERTRNKLVSKSSSGRLLKWGEKWDTQRLEWGWQAFSIKGQTVNIMNFIANSLCQSYSILQLQHESRHRQYEANGQSCVPYNFIYKNRHLAHSSLLTTGLESKLCYIKMVMVSTLSCFNLHFEQNVLMCHY